MANKLIFLLIAVMTASVVFGCASEPEKEVDAEAASFLFFPLPPAQPRVQFLTFVNGSEDVEGKEKGTFKDFIVGADPTPPKLINKPQGIAARDGVVYVCDTKALNLTRIDFKNGKFDLLGTEGPGRLLKPLNLIIDPLGFKFVVDLNRKQIVIFDPQDRYSTAFDVPAPCRPVDVALYGNELYVLDNHDETCRIVVMDRSDGKVLRTFGSRGKEAGTFNRPAGLTIDADGFLYVSDTINFRIQKLTREGKVVWERGGAGYHLQQFGRPKGMRVGPDGIVYVVEAAMELVKMYNDEGQVLMYFGGPGNRAGALLLPHSVAPDKTSIEYFKKYVHEDFIVDYLLFVTSQYGPHKISVYAKGSFPEGYKLSESDVTVLPRLPASGKTVWTPNPSGDAVKPEPGQKPGQLPGEAPKAKPEEEKKK